MGDDLPDAADELLELFVDDIADQDIDGFALQVTYPDGTMYSAEYAMTSKSAHALSAASLMSSEKIQDRIRDSKQQTRTADPPEGRIGFQ